MKSENLNKRNSNKKKMRGHRLGEKADLWAQIKQLRDENGYKLNITYKKSNPEMMRMELRRLKNLKSKGVPRQTPKKLNNILSFTELWKEIKQFRDRYGYKINISYRKAKTEDLENELRRLKNLRKRGLDFKRNPENRYITPFKRIYEELYNKQTPNNIYINKDNRVIIIVK